jgi:hypothetical protein
VACCSPGWPRACSGCCPGWAAPPAGLPRDRGIALAAADLLFDLLSLDLMFLAFGHQPGFGPLAVAYAAANIASAVPLTPGSGRQPAKAKAMAMAIYRTSACHATAHNDTQLP